MFAQDVRPSEELALWAKRWRKGRPHEGEERGSGASQPHGPPRKTSGRLPEEDPAKRAGEPPGQRLQ